MVWSRKSVWSRSNSVFIFLTNCMHHFDSYILLKTPMKLVNWFQRYALLKDATNNRKQKTFSALFDSIFKSIFPTSDWFCLITSHIARFKCCKALSWLKGSQLGAYFHKPYSNLVVLKTRNCLDKSKTIIWALSFAKNRGCFFNSFKAFILRSFSASSARRF